MIRLLIIILASIVATSISAQPTTKATKKRLGSYFATYENTAYSCKEKAKVEKLTFVSEEKAIVIAVSETFLGQPFTNELVAKIYNEIKDYLPPPYNEWKITITVNGYPIEKLVPVETLPEKDTLRHWGDTKFEGNAWTR